MLAKGSLLDVERKSEYDAELREQPSQPVSTPVSAAILVKNDSPPRVGQDPRFPPGMGPNDARPPADRYQPPARTERAEPEPRRVETRESEQRPMQAPVTAVAAPFAQPVPATAWPDSMLHPAPHGQSAQPIMAQLAPQNPPGYAAQPQSVYQQPPGYPATQPAYAAPPMQPAQAAPYGQQPLAQPVYGQPAYAQPAAYGQPAPYAMPTYAAPYAQPVPGAPYGAQPHDPHQPVHYGSAPGYSGGYNPPAAPSTSYGSSGYGHYAPADAMTHVAAPSAPLDPMAPVALPPSAAPAASPTGSIPKGKAVSAAPSAAPAAAESVGASSQIATMRPLTTGPMNAPGGIPPRDLVTYADTSSTEKLVLYGTISAVILLVGAIAFAIANANRGRETLAENSEPPASQPLPRIESPITKPATPPNSATVQKPPQPAPGATRPAPEPMLPAPMPVPEQPKPEPVKPDPMKPEPMKPEPVNLTPPAPEPTKPEPIKPEPVKPEPPKPPEPMPVTKLTPVEAATLSKAMMTARDALSERNFEEFEKQHAVAQQLARSQDQKDKVSRLMVLGIYVKQFDRQLKTLLADENFDAGAELKIGKSTVVNVVERSPTTLVIRVAGVNKSYNVSSLPDGLAMALIDKRLDATDPVRHLVKGAYLAAAKVPTDETKEKAKELFEQATREGADAGDLALVLTDSYDFKE
jgi:hypothetical protein